MSKIKKKKEFNIDFEKSGGLVPAIIQCHVSKQVLMLGYMNSEAFEKTIASNRVVFFSRSKKRLWEKGEESGNFLEVKTWKVDCDGDTLLFGVKAPAKTCHLDQYSCFGDEEFTLKTLQKIIAKRWMEKEGTSYVQKLKSRGVKKMAQKVGEEAVEVALEAMTPNLKELKGELADMFFHTLVLMRSKGLTIQDVEKVLGERHVARIGGKL